MPDIQVDRAYGNTEKTSDPKDVKGEVTVLDMETILESDNLATALPQEELDAIGAQVCEGYRADLATRTDVGWERETAEARKLAQMITEEKNFPWPEASNLVMPIIAQAAIQFSSRSFTKIVQDDKPVVGKVLAEARSSDVDGKLQAEAEQLGDEISTIITEKIPDWVQHQDDALIADAIVGCFFKKTWYDPVIDMVRSEYVDAEHIILDYKAKSIEKCDRITHRYCLTTNEIKEHETAGLFLELDYDRPTTKPQPDLNQNSESGDTEQVSEPPQGRTKDEEQGYRMFFEQHGLLDLDNDGYLEPYVITTEEKTEQVARIVARFDEEDISYIQEEDEDSEDTIDTDEIARIVPDNCFIQTKFFPSLDGGVYGMGLGRLLLGNNKAINLCLNLLAQAGQRQVGGGGFIDKGIRFQGSELFFKPAVYQTVETVMAGPIADHFYEPPHPGPSPVLLAVLTLLIEETQKTASVVNILLGQQPGPNTPVGTVMASIEQGLKPFTAVYTRVHNGLRQEFRRIYKLLKRHGVLTKYEQFPIDVAPLNDPSSITDTQALLKAQMLMELRGTGRWSDKKIEQRYVQAGLIEDISELEPREEDQPPPSPEMLTLQLKQQELALKEREVVIKEHEMMIKKISELAKVEKTRAEAIRALADAESKELGPQLDYYQTQLEELSGSIDKIATSFTNRGAYGQQDRSPQQA